MERKAEPPNPGLRFAPSGLRLLGFLRTAPSKAQMDKRYQVFVSSTFADLQDERQAVMQALLSLDHFPAGMELFPASDEDAWTLIKGVIDDSDYYVLVIGGRYGTTNDTGVSYTEMEFDYAVKNGAPILAFIHQSPELIASGKTDQNDALRARLTKFRSRVEADHHAKYWTNADDLKAKVIQSISAETKRNPREGWVRAGRASDPIITEQLRQEIDRLKEELNSVRVTPPPGADQYAGDVDEYVATVNCQTGDYTNREWHTLKVTVTWNQILYELGPVLLEEANETQIHRRLNEELWRYNYDAFPDNSDNFSVTNDDFETIKVQLLALGLIQRSQRKHVPSDTGKYWSLTPFGENALMKLRAIPKNFSSELKSES